MSQDNRKPHAGVIVEESLEFTVVELCQACTLDAALVAELVEHGVLEPSGGEAGQWRFPGPSLYRARVAARLQRDLGVNAAGIALALELMSELEAMRSRLAHLTD
jgi:chaperone modulatory protein CbpM